MSSILPQTTLGDPERESNTGDQTESPNPQSKGTVFADSSGPFFTLYSEAAEYEDNKMIKRWQDDAKGILIFTGLFSAALAALLTVTVQDLRPNSQDTSAFYLGNIYDVLADPNATRASIPPPVAKPPPFSAPRHAVWVNSLWFLSLIISLSCALFATLLQQWARRYVRLTQPARRGPEKRARMRAFYCDGVDKMHVSWAVEGLPTLLHLSLFLFFGGLAIFLFNIDKEVFVFVVCWIGIFLLVYGLITVLPFIRRNSPYYTPLSKPAWFLHASTPFITIMVRYYIVYVFHVIRYGADSVNRAVFPSLAKLRDRYYDRISEGMEKWAEEMTEEQELEIDLRIFRWTISLGDDASLEKFFEAIPGLFTSELVKDLEKHFPRSLFQSFWTTMNNFMERTLSSYSVTKEAKDRRVAIFEDIATVIPPLGSLRTIELLVWSFDNGRRPVSIGNLWVLARWRNYEDTQIADGAQTRMARLLPRIQAQERDDRWITLASDEYCLSRPELQNNVHLGGDNTLLATLIGVCRRATRQEEVSLDALKELIRIINIYHTLPGLQHEFCTLWNELIRIKNSDVLYGIRDLYISLHGESIEMIEVPWYFPLCDNPQARHLPDSPPRFPVPGAPPIPRQVAVPSSPSDPTTPGKTGDTSHDPAATEPTEPVHTGSQNTDAPSPSAVAAAPQDTSPVPMLSYTLRGTAKIAAADAASPSSPLLPASSVVNFYITAIPPSNHVRPFPGADSLALLSSTTPSSPTGNATLGHPRARGLVNTGGMCFANAVLQLLVHSPPFWNLFRELDDLKERREEGPETPLTDATARFFAEFVFKEPPPTQRPLGQAARRKPSEDASEGEEETRENKIVDSFDPTYMYDAMKEKKQFKDLLDGRHEDAAELLSLYLDALDEELVKLQVYVSTWEAASAPKVEILEENVRSASGQTEVPVRKRDYMASSVESPISLIFGGKSRKTVRVPSQPDIVTIEDIEAWRSLQLNIQPDSVHTIEDALARVSQPRSRSLQVAQSSSSLNEEIQEVLLKELPQILVLHLKRFMYDAAAQSINRIRKPIQFGPELEIPLEIMVPAAGKSTKPMHYKLCGILYHHGESQASGHYTVDVLHQNGDSSSGEAWLHIDDEAVSAVQHEDVFGGQENEQVDEGCVYMLFYCRTAPAKG